MRARVLSIAALGLAALGVWVLWPEAGAPIPAPGTAPGGEVAAPGEDELQATPRSGAASRRESPGATEVGAGPVRTFHGLVFAADGRPLVAFAVAQVPAGSSGDGATSDGAGRFVLPVPEERGEVHVAAEGWATVVAGVVEPSPGGERIEPVVVAAEATACEGRVVDGSGEPVAGAVVRCVLPAAFAAGIPASLDASRPLHHGWRATSDGEGRFAMAGVGRVSGARVVARASGYLPVEADQGSGDAIVLVLRRPDADAERILGQVIDPRGLPAPGAAVLLGRSRATSDERGLFSLSRSDSRGAEVIVALKRGYLPGSIAVPPQPEDGPAPFVYVPLGAEPSSIAGRVVTSRGEPVPGARVWAREQQAMPGLNGSVEGFLAGGATDAELRERFTVDGRMTLSMDEIKERNPTAAWGWVRTDASGGFELGGLRERAYTLGVFHEERLQSVVAGPFHAGTRDARIVFEPEVEKVIAGRVVGLDGSPIPDVEVQVNRWVYLSESSDPDGGTWSSADALPGPRLRTDAEGRFRVEDLGKGGVWLTLSGDRVMSRNFGLDERGLENATERPLDDLLLTVARRMHLRLELGDPELADAFAVVDVGGEELPIVVFDGGGRSSSTRRPVHEGRTRVYAVSEAVRAVVLYRQEREVRRILVALLPGEVLVVRQ